MPSPALTALFSSVLFATCAMAGAQDITAKKCAENRESILKLDEDQFDQDMPEGWRRIFLTPGCELVAAELLHDYRETHHKDSFLLYWHEAQIRATLGQYMEAIDLMQHSYMPPESANEAWDAYVDATIAFLRREKSALAQAKLRLAAVPPPKGADMPPVINGYMEITSADGGKSKMRWPPNIDVVEGLQKCFDMPYIEAYKDACRLKNN